MTYRAETWTWTERCKQITSSRDEISIKKESETRTEIRNTRKLSQIKETWMDFVLYMDENRIPLTTLEMKMSYK